MYMKISHPRTKFIFTSCSTMLMYLDNKKYINKKIGGKLYVWNIFHRIVLM